MGAHFLHFIPKFPSIYRTKMGGLCNKMHQIGRVVSFNEGKEPETPESAVLIFNILIDHIYIIYIYSGSYIYYISKVAFGLLGV